MNIPEILRRLGLLQSPPDIAETISSLQERRIRVAMMVGGDLNHRACWKYTRAIRNLLCRMDEEERRFLADGGPEYPIERIR